MAVKDGEHAVEVFIVPFRSEKIIYADAINDGEAVVVVESKASQEELVIGRVNLRTGAVDAAASFPVQYAKQFLITSDCTKLHILMGIPSLLQIDLGTLSTTARFDLIQWDQGVGELGLSRDFFEFVDRKRVFHSDVDSETF